MPVKDEPSVLVLPVRALRVASVDWACAWAGGAWLTKKTDSAKSATVRRRSGERRRARLERLFEYRGGGNWHGRPQDVCLAVVVSGVEHGCHASYSPTSKSDSPS